jgi:hypothetical protein
VVGSIESRGLVGRRRCDDAPVAGRDDPPAVAQNSPVPPAAGVPARGLEPERTQANDHVFDSTKPLERCQCSAKVNQKTTDDEFIRKTDGIASEAAHG